MILEGGIEKARKLATEVAHRLASDGAEAEFLTEFDRRTYVLARAEATSLGLEVDTACQKLAHLQKRLKNGTLEDAVTFFNDHGQRVRRGATVEEVRRVMACLRSRICVLIRRPHIFCKIRLLPTYLPA